MPSLDYKAYAATPQGKAARAKARAKWLAKRKAQAIASPALPTAHLNKLITGWAKP